MDEKFDMVCYLSNEQDGMAIINDSQSEIRLFEFNDQYVRQVIPYPPNMVCIQMKYDYQTLMLKEKGQYLKNGGVNIGIWEFYNNKGELESIEDTDAHFIVTWTQMEKILNDKNISLLSINSIYRHYDEEKNYATWSIIIKLPADNGCLYVFDAKTGELIMEEIIDMKEKM